jgi:hypothetical protein
VNKLISRQTEEDSEIEEYTYIYIDKSCLLVEESYTVRQLDKETERVRNRVSSETSFISKQPKLEPKLVSALSETRRLFRLFSL